MSQAYNPSDLVLVTGANGHVAQHVVDQLLALPAGPRVRATVRSNTTATQITNFYKDKDHAKNRLLVVVVPDIVVPGAFDDAVKDVTHIAHIASPLIIGAKDIANELLKPAMQGTVGILSSALKSPTVQAVVVTSSFGSVFDPKRGWRSGYKYTSADWNPITFEEAASPDLDLDSYPETWRPYITYCASKVVAERAAWDFQTAHSPHFTLSFVLPTYIGGPNILPLAHANPASSLSFSQSLIYNTATDPVALPKMDWPGWVDVRDVARAHVNALVTPAAAGKRWIVSAGMASYEDIADVVRRRFPALTPSSETQRIEHYTIDASPALRALGLGTYIPLEKTVVDTLRDVVDKDGRAVDGQNT
ncbi:aldehyde reductase II [Athelia psychrophila]|uniref:Aldehyde reductase II n=1 Tax=Athelia psychrophila TaxID=1759441 RepID=A0A167UHK9_9AGAM|nr:aldehyde reductase II [Fibularhizoctonia sp. CBS 109695]